MEVWDSITRVKKADGNWVHGGELPGGRKSPLGIKALSDTALYDEKLSFLCARPEAFGLLRRRPIQNSVITATAETPCWHG